MIKSLIHVSVAPSRILTPHCPTQPNLYPPPPNLTQFIQRLISWADGDNTIFTDVGVCSFERVIKLVLSYMGRPTSLNAAIRKGWEGRKWNEMIGNEQWRFWKEQVMAHGSEAIGVAEKGECPKHWGSQKWGGGGSQNQQGWKNVKAHFVTETPEGGCATTPPHPCWKINCASEVIDFIFPVIGKR